LDGLPQQDQNAIVAIVGKPVLLVGYDEVGRAELHFDDPFDVRTDESSHTHSIWVDSEFIERHPAVIERARGGSGSENE